MADTPSSSEPTSFGARSSTSKPIRATALSISIRPPGGGSERWEQLGSAFRIRLPGASTYGDSRWFWHFLQHTGQRIGAIQAPSATSVWTQLLRHGGPILSFPSARAGRFAADTGRRQQGADRQSFGQLQRGSTQLQNRLRAAG